MNWCPVPQAPSVARAGWCLMVPPSVSGLTGETTELEVAAMAALSALVTAWLCHCLATAWELGSDPGPWAGQVTALP